MIKCKGIYKTFVIFLLLIILLQRVSFGDNEVNTSVYDEAFNDEISDITIETPDENVGFGIDSIMNGLSYVKEKVIDAAENVSDVWNGVTTVADWTTKFLKNPIGTLVNLKMDIDIFLWGDSVQWLSNSLQESEKNTILYSYDDLKDDKYKKDKYTKVSQYTKDDGKIHVNVKKNRNGNRARDFSKDTKIPVLVGDIYSVATGHINLFDVNFLTGQNEKTSDGTLVHESGSKWLAIRSVAFSLIRMCIYITSAILLIFLVWFGIKCVGSSIKSPELKVRYKKGLERFEVALLMMIGSIIIMSLCIFGVKAMSNGLLDTGDSYELPIRVNVEDTYSFSTTFAGFIRYMCLNDDMSEWMLKILYGKLYISLAWLNMIVMIVMLLRVILLWILAFVGPILAILYIFNPQKLMSFMTWIKLYVGLSSIQLFIAIGYKIILKIMEIV